MKIIIGEVVFLATTTAAIALSIYFKKRNTPDGSDTVELSGYAKLVGNTPLIELHALSKKLKRRILVKMESMNPGGTGKDRAAKGMLSEAMKMKGFTKETTIVEGTSGSTGIALACQCHALGLQLHVVMPDDQAKEKTLLLQRLGAKVTIVPNCGISNKDHYVNSARRLADECKGIFMNQFENLANFQVHYQETGPEIYSQCNGNIDAFVMSAGTGGTIAGVSRYLKEKNPRITVCLADPEGSSLFQRVAYGVCFTSQQTERKLRKHRYDSIVEGVGLDRVTANFQEALIDVAEKVVDQEVIEMAHYILREEGLFVGSSSALNLVATCRLAARLPEGANVVTIICDSGHRHISRFWNPCFYEQNAETGSYTNVKWPSENCIPECLQ